MSKGSIQRLNSDRLDVNSDRWKSLLTIAEPVRQKGKDPKDKVRETILMLCKDEFLTPRQFSELLGRSPHALKNSYLSEMIQNNQLELRYLDVHDHPQQAYRSWLKMN